GLERLAHAVDHHFFRLLPPESAHSKLSHSRSLHDRNSRPWLGPSLRTRNARQALPQRGAPFPVQRWGEPGTSFGSRSQTTMRPPSPPATQVKPSGLKASAPIVPTFQSFAEPGRSLPVAASHRRMTPFSSAVARVLPSGLNATAVAALWPLRV